ncbi:MAG TPA: DUF6624 domain-containing protein, partial [Bacteroidia bacterium]|nr:DUF6624 domain-containing protein [Bacteroidia bacterium]
ASKAASDVVFKRYGLPSPQMDSMDRVIGDIDSMNILNLEKLFNKYGWMGKELIGLEAVNRVFIILLHAPLSYQKKYFNFIEAAVNKGELQKQCIAYLTDKILAKKGKKQLYGTQLQYSRETKSYHFKPIENEKDVNSRRKEYGLRPIEDYAKDFGIDYRVQ